MEKSKKSALIKRAVTSLILVPLTLAVLYYGIPYINIMTLIFGTALSWEWAMMMKSKKAAAFSAIYTAALAVVVVSPSINLILMGVSIATLIAWVVAKDEQRRGLLTLGVPYIAIGLGSTIWFYYIMGPLMMLWLIVLVWGVDVGGFVVGNSLKGPKLAPKISPNKTWSGFFGGMLLAVSFSLVFVRFFGPADGFGMFALYAVVIAILAQIGDLVESAIKRKVGVKDSSNLIPGHGGVFDRVDGLIFTTPLVLFSLYVVSMFM